MEAKSIKKISDAELTEAALEYAQKICKVIEGNGRSDQNFFDSLNKVYDIEILLMKPGDARLRAVERQVIEAYSSIDGKNSPGENLQKMGNDSLFYTKPIFNKGPNGSLEFVKALSLRIHKKAVILSIKN